MKKNVNLKGIIIVLVIGFFSISVIKQVIVLKRIKSDISTQAQELEELKEKNIKLQAELDRAQSNNEYLEKLARERLGLIKEGEQQIIPSNEVEQYWFKFKFLLIWLLLLMTQIIFNFKEDSL